MNLFRMQEKLAAGEHGMVKHICGEARNLWDNDRDKSQEQRRYLRLAQLLLLEARSYSPGQPMARFLVTHID